MASRTKTLEILQQADLHGVGERAHALRQERFGSRSSFAAVEHVAAGEHAFCSICGQRPTQRAWLSPRLDGVDGSASELHVIPAPGADGAALLDSAPAVSMGARGLERTAVVGVASDWMHAAGGADGELLTRARERGLKVLADGVLPSLHPARGAEASARWSSFWSGAAAVGLRGFASLFYGPGHDDDSVAAQLEAIARLQGECGVFLSVCPMVDPGSSFGGVQDGLLTHGDVDLRILAACRLALPGVEHLTLLYNRTDLKMAHIALLGGVDDLSGHLALGERGLREDVNHEDLSLSEMESWMRDAGMEAQLRNACFETAAP